MVTLLGSPLHEHGLTVAARKAAEMVSLLCTRLQSLEAHLGFFFLSHYVSAPRLTYLLRSCPIFKVDTILREVDENVRMTLTQVVNADVTGDAWTQATLPARIWGVSASTVSLTWRDHVFSPLCPPR